MSKKQNDFSAFDEVMSNPDNDFSAFDDTINKKEPNLLQKIYTSEIPFTPFIDPSLKDIVETGESALKTAQDFSIGAAKGLTLNAMDELGGAIGAGVETGLSYIPGTSAYEARKIDEQLKAQGFEVPEESALEKYRTYQQGVEQAQEEAAARSPVASIGGEITGSMTGGALLGPLLGLGTAPAIGPKALLSQIAQNQGKAKAAMDLLRGTATTGSRLVDLGVKGVTSYAKAAPLMAVEGALTSEKQLFGPEADVSGVMSDVGTNLAFGVPAVLGLEAASEGTKMLGGKVKEVAKKFEGRIQKAIQDEDNPRLRQLVKTYKEYGQKLGINPRSHAADIGPDGFSQRDQKAVNSVLDILNSADEKLGQEVGDSLVKATNKGSLININPEIESAFNRISELSKVIPQLGKSRKSQDAYAKILQGKNNFSPVELKNLIDDIDSSIGIFKAATNKGPQDVSTLNELIQFRKNISDTLKKSVPEYRDSAQRFEQFRNVLEQIISGAKPADITEKFYGNLENQQDKLYTKLLDIIENVQSTSRSNQSSRTAFSNFMESLGRFEQSNPSKAKQLFDSQGLRKFILDASDDSNVRGGSRNVMESRGVIPDLKEAFIGKLPITGAYLAGKTNKIAAGLAQKPLIKNTIDLSKRIYNAPAQSLSNVASRLEASQNFSNLGKALRESIESGDTYKKNAALFTIMQNPNAKALINSDDLEEDYVTDQETE